MIERKYLIKNAVEFGNNCGLHYLTRKWTGISSMYFHLLFRFRERNKEKKLYCIACVLVSEYKVLFLPTKYFECISIHIVTTSFHLFDNETTDYISHNGSEYYNATMHLLVIGYMIYLSNSELVNFYLSIERIWILFNDDSYMIHVSAGACQYM